MGPKITRKQAYFHDESTFFKAFQLKLEDNLFFSWGLRPFWDFFGLRKAVRPFEGQKNPKKAEGRKKKTNCLTAEAEKPEKKLTNHENKPAFLLSEVAYNIYANLSMNIIFHIIRTSFCLFNHFILSLLRILLY